MKQTEEITDWHAFENPSLGCHVDVFTDENDQTWFLLDGIFFGYGLTAGEREDARKEFTEGDSKEFMYAGDRVDGISANAVLSLGKKFSSKNEKFSSWMLDVLSKAARENVSFSRCDIKNKIERIAQLAQDILKKVERYPPAGNNGMPVKDSVKELLQTAAPKGKKDLTQYALLQAVRFRNKELFDSAVVQCADDWTRLGAIYRCLELKAILFEEAEKMIKNAEMADLREEKHNELLENVHL